MTADYALRNYSGNAVKTNLTTGMTNSDTTTTLAASTGWPSSAFWMVLDIGQTTEELVYVGTRSGLNLSGIIRNVTGGGAFSHSAGGVGTVAHVGSYQDFVEANAVAAALTTKGDLLGKGATSTVAPARLAVGTDGQRLAADSTQALGLKWVTDTQNSVVDAAGDMLIGTADNVVAKLATSGLTGTTSPTWSTVLAQGATNNITKTVNRASHMQIGKLVFFWVKVTSTGAGTANNAITLSLPVTAASSGHTMPGGGFVICTAQVTGISYLATTTTCALLDTTITGGAQIGATGSSSAVALANGHVVYMSGVYEAA